MISGSFCAFLAAPAAAAGHTAPVPAKAEKTDDEARVKAALPAC